MPEPREDLALALQAALTPEQLDHLINEVLAITKKGRAEFNCRHCGKRQVQFAEIPDAKAVALALPDLLNQAYGRPGEWAGVSGGVNFYRLTRMEEIPEEALAAAASAQEALGALPRAEGE